LQQLTARILDVREPVDVELEDLGRVLHAEPVAGAEILIDPDSQRLGVGRQPHHEPPGIGPGRPYRMPPTTNLQLLTEWIKTR